MSADGLANIIGRIPYATVRWKGERDGVYTVLCRITPAQENGWETLAFTLMDCLKHSKLFVAKQLIELHGQRGYLWNVSLWTQDAEGSLRAMFAVISRAFSNPQQDYAVRSQDPRARKSKIEEDPEMRDAQRNVLRTRKREAVSQEHIRAERRSGRKKEFVLSLPGGTNMRNIPRGMVEGAEGRMIPSEKGAKGILGR